MKLEGGFSVELGWSPPAFAKLQALLTIDESLLLSCYNLLKINHQSAFREESAIVP
jgi:hypothetical protein